MKRLIIHAIGFLAITTLMVFTREARGQGVRNYLTEGEVSAYGAAQLGNAYDAKARNIRIFGRNTDVDGSREVLSSLGGSVSFVSAALKVRIEAGGSANDTAAGSGAQAITIEGIDNSWDPVSETIATNGASVSALSTNTYFRVYRAFVSEIGTYGSANDGDVVVEFSDGTDEIKIVAGDGESQSARFTVERNAKLIVSGIRLNTSSAATSAFLIVRDRADETSDNMGSKREIWSASTLTGIIQPQPPKFDFNGSPIVIDGPADIWMEAVLTSGSNATIEGYFYAKVIKD